MIDTPHSDRTSTSVCGYKHPLMIPATERVHCSRVDLKYQELLSITPAAVAPGYWSTATPGCKVRLAEGMPALGGIASASAVYATGAIGHPDLLRPGRKRHGGGVLLPAIAPTSEWPAQADLALAWRRPGTSTRSPHGFLVPARVSKPPARRSCGADAIGIGRWTDQTNPQTRLGAHVLKQPRGGAVLSHDQIERAVGIDSPPWPAPRCSP